LVIVSLHLRVAEDGRIQRNPAAGNPGTLARQALIKAKSDVDTGFMVPRTRHLCTVWCEPQQPCRIKI